MSSTPYNPDSAQHQKHECCTCYSLGLCDTHTEYGPRDRALVTDGVLRLVRSSLSADS